MGLIHVPQCSVSDSLSLIPTLPLHVSLLTSLPHNSFCVNSKLGKLRQTQSSVIFTNQISHLTFVLAPTCFDLPLSHIASQSPLYQNFSFHPTATIMSRNFWKRFVDKYFVNRSATMSLVGQKTSLTSPSLTLARTK